MDKAPLPLIIPHWTKIDETHRVVGKGPNVFIGRTDKVRSIGYDAQIRMNDHDEFYLRCAGHLVACMDETAEVFHCHNMFDSHYAVFRNNTKGDNEYIKAKHGK